MKFIEEQEEDALFFNIPVDGNVSEDGLDDEDVDEENDIVTFLSESENLSNFSTPTFQILTSSGDEIRIRKRSEMRH